MRRLLPMAVRAAAILTLASVGSGHPSAAAAPGHGVQQEQPQEPDDKEQRVTGNVVDRDGKAADRVQVEFDGPKKETVWTDSRGEFSFTGPPGDYVVTVKTGEAQQQFKVKIENNRLIPSTLELDPEPLA